jgi:hypothetical protein
MIILPLGAAALPQLLRNPSPVCQWNTSMIREAGGHMPRLPKDRRQDPGTGRSPMSL